MKNISLHHTTSLYYEILCKLILECVENIKLKLCDRPDLQNENVEIEVTSAFPRGYDQAIALMQKGCVIEGKLKNAEYVNTINMPGFLKRPEKECIHWNPFPSLNYIIDAVRNKVDKISNYNNFVELNLFVFTDNIFEEKEAIKNLVEKIIENNDGQFNIIYLLYLTFILKINCVSHVYRKIGINNFKELDDKAIELENSYINGN